MNTRLQVEHPVTELITGIDLVAWQLSVAAGNPLPLAQKDIKAQGHAIECRIYAEDPYKDFIPSIGRLDFIQEPKGEGIRIDTGVQTSSQISMYYDPMIAKLIAYGSTREEALQRLNQALNHYYIAGVKTNIPFLQAICQEPHFIKAQVCTDFLVKHAITLHKPKLEQGLLLAASYDYLQTVNTIKDPLLKDSFCWQMHGLGYWSWSYRLEGELVEVVINPVATDEFILSINSVQHQIKTEFTQNNLTIEHKNQRFKAVAFNQDSELHLFTEQGLISIERFNWNTMSLRATSHKGQLTAPMPATVVAVLKQIGDSVKAGDSLIVLEAMKMEHTIHAPNDGVLLDIFYAVGAQVNEGAELLTLSEANA
jgi:3-methylcrotonyl-CoA carboxylase alpha subunit